MASIFWDSKGIIMVDYLEEGRTTNGAYYAETLRRLRQKTMIERRGKLIRGVLLLQANAPAHTSQVAMAATIKCSFEVLPLPHYSTYLAPSDICLFSNLKTYFVVGILEAVKSLNILLMSIWAPDFYFEGVSKLNQRWRKYINAKEDYIEKWHNFCSL